MLRVLVAVSLITSTPVLATSNDAVSVEADKPVKEKKVCKSSQATGSIMVRRVCRTQTEWDSMTAKSQADLDRTRDMERSRGMVGATRN